MVVSMRESRSSKSSYCGFGDRRRIVCDGFCPTFCKEQRSERVPHFIAATELKTIYAYPVDTRAWRRLDDSDVH
jgi:hypothetical protein